MISGAIKLSIFPFHIWLGKVHVEAPTIGSILLAGISLKTGFYIHYLFLYLFVYINNTILYLFIFVLFIGIILNNINIFYQIDTKRWIALYSIIHMNLYYIILFVVIFNLNTYNNIYLIFIINIIIYGMISHSLISGGLFLIIGYIYDITNNKNVFVLNHNILSSYIYFILFLLFIFELLAFIHLSLFNILLTILLLILSCSNLLSSLYIYYKYFTNHYYGSIINSNYYDLLLIILILPILIIIILMGMNLLLPIHFLISYYL
jgi:NADH:ubiquinone oxidoreductase subunit 4 (subunit M)